nr:reverse transcriptase domain-containing protein [Tanacetum cinerariifolium]
MADRTMEELLQAPIEGYGEAIVIPKILTENFKIKTNLLQLVETNKFHGFEKDNSQNLFPGVTPVAKSPYRLAPSKMQELSKQLQELQDKELLGKEKLYAKFTKSEAVKN